MRVATAWLFFASFVFGTLGLLAAVQGNAVLALIFDGITVLYLICAASLAKRNNNLNQIRDGRSRET